MDNDANINAHKNKINPDVWRLMKAAAIMQNLKIYEWIERAIIDKLNNDSGVKK
jgi:hypothetical protein